MGEQSWLTATESHELMAAISSRGEAFVVAGLRGNELPSLGDIDLWVELLVPVIGQGAAVDASGAITDWFVAQYRLGTIMASPCGLD